MFNRGGRGRGPGLFMRFNLSEQLFPLQHDGNAADHTNDDGGSGGGTPQKISSRPTAVRKGRRPITSSTTKETVAGDKQHPAVKKMTKKNQPRRASMGNPPTATFNNAEKGFDSRTISGFRSRQQQQQHAPITKQSRRASTGGVAGMTTNTTSQADVTSSPTSVRKGMRAIISTTKETVAGDKQHPAVKKNMKKRQPRRASMGSPPTATFNFDSRTSGFRSRQHQQPHAPITKQSRRASTGGAAGTTTTCQADVTSSSSFFSPRLKGKFKTSNLSSHCTAGILSPTKTPRQRKATTAAADVATPVIQQQKQQQQQPRRRFSLNGGIPNLHLVTKEVQDSTATPVLRQSRLRSCGGVIGAVCDSSKSNTNTSTNHELTLNNNNDPLKTPVVQKKRLVRKLRPKPGHTRLEKVVSEEEDDVSVPSTPTTETAQSSTTLSSPFKTPLLSNKTKMKPGRSRTSPKSADGSLNVTSGESSSPSGVGSDRPQRRQRTQPQPQQVVEAGDGGTGTSNPFHSPVRRKKKQQQQLVHGIRSPKHGSSSDSSRAGTGSDCLLHRQQQQQQHVVSGEDVNVVSDVEWPETPSTVQNIISSPSKPIRRAFSNLSDGVGELVLGVTGTHDEEGDGEIDKPEGGTEGGCPPADDQILGGSDDFEDVERYDVVGAEPEEAHEEQTEMPTKLYDCARRCQWEEVLEECRLRPRDAKYVSKKDGTTALHLAVMSRSNPEMRNGGFEGYRPAPRLVVEALLVACPEAAITRCHVKRYTPLTYACLVVDERYDTAEAADMIMTILRHAPQSAFVFTDEGFTPMDIHILSYSLMQRRHSSGGRGEQVAKKVLVPGDLASTVVLKTLLSEKPSLAKPRAYQNNVRGPLELLYRCNMLEFKRAADGEVDSVVLRDWWAWEWALLILEYGMQDEKSKTAVSPFRVLQATAQHVACPSAILHLAITLRPEQVSSRDPKDDRYNMPIHDVASWRVDQEIISGDQFILRRKVRAMSLLLEKYPEGVRSTNNFGETPLQLAIESGTPWNPGLAILVRACPKALKFPKQPRKRPEANTNRSKEEDEDDDDYENDDSAAGMYPFMVAAVFARVAESEVQDLSFHHSDLTTEELNQGIAKKDIESLRTIYGLLRARPGSLAQYRKDAKKQNV